MGWKLHQNSDEQMKHNYLNNEIFCLLDRTVIDVHCLLRFEERFSDFLKYFVDDRLEILVDAFLEAKQTDFNLAEDTEYFYVELSFFDNHSLFANSEFLFIVENCGKRILKTCYSAHENKKFNDWYGLTIKKFK